MKYRELGKIFLDLKTGITYTNSKRYQFQFHVNSIY
jgi:hypothetical protein